MALLCLIWFWLVLGVTDKGAPRRLGLMTLQLSIFSAVFGFLITGSAFGSLAALFPPVLLLFPTIYLLAMPYLLFPFGLAAVVTTLGTFTFARSLTIGFEVIVTPVLLTFVVLFLFAGELQSRWMMCERAATLDVQHFERNSFLWSFAFLNNAPHGSLHAGPELGDQRYRWSYAGADWVKAGGLRPEEFQMKPMQCWQLFKFFAH
jgi:hypothetical protein